MPDRLPPGPYRHLRLSDGTDVPYYIIPFDKQGRCEGPESRKHLIESAKTQGYTDVFFFSHGWNNDWAAATQRYEDFIEGYMEMRRKHSLPVPAGYKPLLVGIFWPSTALVFKEDEVGPDIAGDAGDNPEAMDAAVAEERQQVREVAEALPPDADVERFYELSQKEALDEEEALELARILAPLYRTKADELDGEPEPKAEEILEVWQAAAAPPPDFTDFGTAGGGGDDGPQAAGLMDVFRKLDPRGVIRLFTVWQMKDRAGVVGARGAGPLLRDLLQASPARVHLVGHSYGAKVVLSAVAAADLPRKVESILLLQPAVSHLCFADKVPGTDRPGGYRRVLDRVNKPVLSTFSAHDFPLTRVFHVAVRRAGDLGEVQIAADEPPSKYAALGGFGPRKAGEKLIDILDRPQKYDLQGARVFGVKGTRTIAGHGDISNESTWWALYNLASG